MWCVLEWTLLGILSLSQDFGRLASDSSACTISGILCTMPGLMMCPVLVTRNVRKVKIFPKGIIHNKAEVCQRMVCAHMSLTYNLVSLYLYRCHAVSTDGRKYSQGVHQTTAISRDDFSSATLSHTSSVVIAALCLGYQWLSMARAGREPWMIRAAY